MIIRFAAASTPSLYALCNCCRKIGIDTSNNAVLRKWSCSYKVSNTFTYTENETKPAIAVQSCGGRKYVNIISFEGIQN